MEAVQYRRELGAVRHEPVADVRFGVDVARRLRVRFMPRTSRTCVGQLVPEGNLWAARQTSTLFAVRRACMGSPGRGCFCAA